MAVILENRQIAKDVFLLTLSGVAHGAAGQFVQVHLPDEAHLLPRPVSLFDADNSRGEIRLAYRVVGRGTKLLSRLTHGELRVSGPMGNGFPLTDKPAVLIGGGMGIAPLHLLLKSITASNPSIAPTVYLGYSDTVFLHEEFAALSDSIVTDVGGRITDSVDFSYDAVYYACGPAPMMQAAAKKAAEHNRTLYVSLERRMACGVGACYGCSVMTKSGSRRVCKDGPVFDAREVFIDG